MTSHHKLGVAAISEIRIFGYNLKAKDKGNHAP